LDLTGLLDRIYGGAAAIDYGRKGFATRGKAEEGRISYETGISLALSAFKDAQSTADPHTIILVEYIFLAQELQFCEETDSDSLNSLNQAIQSFDDAFLALKAVDDKTIYQGAEQTHPHSKKYRVPAPRCIASNVPLCINGFPKDSFHIACIAHRTRLQNMLRTPGVDPIEKALLKQRFANMSTAQNGYIEKQGKVLA